MNFKERREKKAFLALANGSVFYGYSVGAPLDACGEAVFNTGLSGYQEILSDPSYAGQFLASRLMNGIPMAICVLWPMILGLSTIFSEICSLPECGLVLFSQKQARKLFWQ